MQSSNTNAPSRTAQELTSLTNILHLTHHRNYNQHRLSKWYKSLSSLRRQISHLLKEIQDFDTAVTYSGSASGSGKRKKAGVTGKESKYVKAAREKVEDRVAFLDERYMERWFVAFSNLIADGQYAPLGLMLMGCLARLRRVTRPFSRVVETEEPIAASNTAGPLENLGDEGIMSDFGVVVKREELQMEIPPDDDQEDQDESDRVKEKEMVTPVKEKKKEKRKKDDIFDTEMLSISQKKSKSRTTTKEPKKKKRKKGDAFDDIFASLL